MNTQKLSPTRIASAVLVVTAALAILGSMVKVIWVDGDMWRRKAALRTHEYRTLPAHRGNIYSSDGNIIASTMPVCDLYLDLSRRPKKNDRGRVMKDSKGNVIMESAVTEATFADSNLNKVCQLLHSAAPKLTAAQYREKILTEYNSERPHGCFAVAKKIPYSYWDKIRNVKGWNRLVVLNKDNESVIREIRSHTYGSLAENVIGFYNGDVLRTYTGLEGYYDSILRGQDGKIHCRRLTKGTWLPDDQGIRYLLSADDSANIEQPVIDGSDIVATIDTRYQDIAESSLRDLLTRYSARRGCAILMEVETGYVLACSNLTLDTSNHSRTYKEMHSANVAVSDVYEPGSTFKTVILTAMMNDTTINPNERVRIRQKIFPGKTASGNPNDMHDDHEMHDENGRPIDTADIRTVIAQSSNVGMMELGWKYYSNQRTRLKNAVEKTFYYDLINPDLNVYQAPCHINNLNASQRDFLNFCYGYSTNASALQILTFYNAIAGKGRMMKPLFCKEIINGKKHTKIKPVVLREHICSPETAEIITDMLVGVVETGTGKDLLNPAYSIAGKTGTAQNYRRHTYNASFAGFFPADNPKYSCIVVAEDIPAYGRDAAKVFQKIASCVMAMDKSLGNISLEKKIRYMEEQKLNPWPVITKGNQKEIRQAYHLLNIKYRTADTTCQWTTYKQSEKEGVEGYYTPYHLPSKQIIPDCKGMTIKDAMALLHKMGLNVKFSGCGRVVSQQPKARTPFNKNTTVFLTLENR